MTDYRSAALALGITGLQEEQIDAIADCIRRHRAIARAAALREAANVLYERAREAEGAVE